MQEPRRWRSLVGRLARALAGRFGGEAPAVTAAGRFIARVRARLGGGLIGHVRERTDGRFVTRLRARLGGRLTPRNALAVAFWMLVAALFVGAGAVLLAALSPEAVGLSPDEVVLDEAYRVEELSYRQGYLRVDFGQGHLIPVYRGGRVGAAIVVGEGRFVLAPEGEDRAHLAQATGFEEIEASLDAVYIPMSYAEFEDLRYRSGGQPEISRVALDRAREVLERRRQVQPLTGSGALLGLLRRPQAMTVFADGPELGAMVYRAGEPHEVLFMDLGALTIRFDSRSPDPSPLLREGALPVSLTIFGSVLLLLLIMVAVLTADLEVVHPASALRLPAEPATWLAALVFVLAEMAVTYATRVRFLTFEPVALYGLFALIALGRPVGGPRALLTGLRVQHPGRSAVLGLLVGLLGFFGASLGVPYGVDPQGTAQLLRLLTEALLLQGLATEVYRRGLLQTTLQALAGRRAGLIASVALVGIVHAAPRIAAAPAAWPTALTEGLLLVPMSEALFAFLYHRTGSVAAGSLARGVLHLCQRLLLF